MMTHEDALTRGKCGNLKISPSVCEIERSVFFLMPHFFKSLKASLFVEDLFTEHIHKNVFCDVWSNPRFIQVSVNT